MSDQQLVIITGAAGFIGSHLVEKFLTAGSRVIGIDNFITSSEANLKIFSDNTNFTFIKADASQSPETYLPSDTKPDVVLHFASPASPPLYQAHPIETYSVNSFGTHFWLQYLKKNVPEAKFVFASTSETYGDPQIHPQPESYWGNVNPNGVRSCYDESKRFGETICGVFQRDFGMDVRIVRIFNTYGPRMNPDDKRVIPDFAMNILQGLPVVIHGTGEQTRSYCYVSDLVEGIFALAQHKKASGFTVNLGNPEEFTINQTAEVIVKVAHQMGLSVTSTTDSTSKPLPGDDPTRRKPDITLAKTLLGWEPKVSFEDGLRPTLEYFKTKVK